jgi:RNA binding exosome subunit
MVSPARWLTSTGSDHGGDVCGHELSDAGIEPTEFSDSSNSWPYGIETTASRRRSAYCTRCSSVPSWLADSSAGKVLPVKRRFSWYLSPTGEELQSIWDSATLSVDANVLLDLYRHHDEARDRILDALRFFSGRLWLTNQAAQEFIRNRTTVIANTAAEYKEAERTLKELEKALTHARDTLKGNRLVPDSVPAALEEGTLATTTAVATAIEAARVSRPDFLKNDPILEAVLELFDNAVGDPPSEEAEKQLRTEAQRRRDKKIPPGYKDAHKEGAQADGDYLLWNEVLQRAKTTERPVILVTSERKEDWWEVHNGKRVGPRRELLEEAHRVAGQRILIVSTDLFVERVATRRGQKVSQAVLFEIREASHRRPRLADKRRDDMADIVQAAVEDLAPTLADKEPVCDLIAETNASGYYPDEINVTSVGDLDLESAEAAFEATIHFSGDQHDDRMWCGDGITAKLEGTVHFDGNEWVVKDDFEVSADIDHHE